MTEGYIIFGERGRINSISRNFKFTPQILSLFGFVVLLGLMVFAVCGVVARLIGHPMKGIIEFTEVLIPIAILLPLVHVQQKRKHIAVDLFSRHFPRRMAYFMDIVKMGVQFLLLAFFSWQLSLRAWNSIQTLEAFKYLGTAIQPYVYPGRICTAIAFLGAAIVAFRQIIGQSGRRPTDIHVD